MCFRLALKNLRSCSTIIIVSPNEMETTFWRTTPISVFLFVCCPIVLFSCFPVCHIVLFLWFSELPCFHDFRVVYCLFPAVIWLYMKMCVCVPPRRNRTCKQTCVFRLGETAVVVSSPARKVSPHSGLLCIYSVFVYIYTYVYIYIYIHTQRAPRNTS